MATINFNTYLFIFPYVTPAILSFVFTIYSFFVKTGLTLKKKHKNEKMRKNSQFKTSFQTSEIIPSLLLTLLATITLLSSADTNAISSNFTSNISMLGSEIGLYILVVFILLLFNFFYKTKNTVNVYHTALLAPAAACVHFIISTTNFVAFTFLIEVLSYFFYFQFLAVNSTTHFGSKKKKLMDLVLLYYWGLFLGSALIIYVNLLLLVTFNTTAFNELTLFYFLISKKSYIFFWLVVSISLKFGITGLHLFKGELYKYLTIDSVVNYSLFTLFCYFTVIFYVFISIPVFPQLVFFKYLPIIIFIGFFTFLNAVTSMDNILLFFGYSGVLTATLCFIILM